MEIYWKVHIKNFDHFIDHIISNYGLINDDLKYFKDYYSGQEYLYLLIDNNNNTDGLCRLSFSGCNDFSDTWLAYNHWIYNGEFHGRKDKLIRLNKIFNS